MTHEEAREIYNTMITPCNETTYDSDTEFDIRLIADTITDAVAAERDACATIAEEMAVAAINPSPAMGLIRQHVARIAAAIRARGAEGKESK